MSRISYSASFHRLRNPVEIVSKVLFQEWNKCLPYIRPWYSVSQSSSPDLVSLLRDHHVSMICHNARQAKLVNHSGLVVVDGKQFGNHEYIIRNSKPVPAPSPVPIWIHTKISNEGVEQTREMFEYIWANKHILSGIVFDISNFTHPTQCIPPSMYSYKVAIDYIFRNMIDPFQKEYGIATPAIMIDGRNHITHIHHLYELHEQGTLHLHANRTNLHLVVDSLLDNCHL
jgi:hypothetical protein